MLSMVIFPTTYKDYNQRGGILTEEQYHKVISLDTSSKLIKNNYSLDNNIYSMTNEQIETIKRIDIVCGNLTLKGKIEEAFRLLGDNIPHNLTSEL